jgi:hypothetical protein
LISAVYRQSASLEQYRMAGESFDLICGVLWHLSLHTRMAIEEVTGIRCT